MKLKWILFLLVSTYFFQGFSQNITSINPDSAFQGQNLTVSVTGSGLSLNSATAVWLKRGNYQIISNTLTPVSANQVNANFSIPPNANVGYYDVECYNVGGPFHGYSRPNWFRVLPNMGGNPAGNVSGNVFLDYDQNCLQNLSGERGLNQRIIEILPGPFYTMTDLNGNFSVNLPFGTYTAELVNDSVYQQSCPTTPQNFILSTGNPIVSGIDFAMETNHYFDVAVHVDIGRIRPWSSQVPVTVTVYNLSGCTAPGGTVTLAYDPQFNFQSSIRSPVSNSNDTIVWNYPNLALGGVERFTTYYSSADPSGFFSRGDIHTCWAQVTSPIDSFLSNNIDSMSSTVTAAYDPNDKSVSPAGIISPDTDLLTYTVRFQNTGNDTAFTVFIRDTLDSSLDVRSLSVEASSHNYTMSLAGSGEIEWLFSNILLPDSNVNEPASHGFVQYSIRPKPNLPLGTEIQNTASIYFDINDPVITNTVVNTMDTLTSISPLIEEEPLVIYPNPASDRFQVRSNVGIQMLRVMDLTGKIWLYRKESLKKDLEIPVKAVPEGIYLVEIHTQKKVIYRKVLVRH